MRISGDHYMAAALERISSAKIMYDRKRHVDTIYLAGVAVECVLRAFASIEDETFDSRHDLGRLLKSATLERFVTENQKKELSGALAEVWSRWKNNYRYIAEERLLSELKRRKLARGIKGDALKENARIVLESAFSIVSSGAIRWKAK